jgi:4-amino-4-deoxy-L-arabinose transferase-like glycosyltransferase
VTARVWLLILLALCIARLWITPLASSFWVDEAETAFVAEHGYHDPSLAIVPQVTASVYYWLPHATYKIVGFSEIAERLPSLAAMVLTLLLIARLAARLIHPDAGWFAVFACLTLRAFNYEAANARPYALGICVAAASLWLLVRWLDSGRWLDGLLFLASAALLWRVQLIYWPFYLVYAIYFLVRRERRVSWAQAATICAGLGLALLPVIPTALAVNREAVLHAFAPQPSLVDLASAFKLRLVAGVAIAAWMFARWRRCPRVDSVPSSPAIALIAGWWAVQPLALFAYSHITGISVFSTRYLSIALPGVALAATAAAAFFLPKTGWRVPALAMGIAALLFSGQWKELWPPHHNSDWRAASQAANALAPGPDTPVLVVSPFIEAQPPLWRPDYPLPGFLYCHLDVYPVTGKPYLLPYEASPAAKEYAEALSVSTLPSARRFLIYAGARDVRLWRDWFAARPEFAQWRSRLLGPFRDVDVALFEAPDNGR